MGVEVSLRLLLVLLLVVAAVAPAARSNAAPPDKITTAQAPLTLGFPFDNSVERRPINIRKTGVNAFANDLRFGTIRSQLLEVKDTLGLRYIRVLFAWDDNVQPTPNSAPNFSFYDEIVKKIPRGVSAVAVLTHLPSWMHNSANWIDGDPRKTFVERWVKPVAARYNGRKRLEALQIWNEPNDDNAENELMGVDDAEGYVSLLSSAYQAVKTAQPRYIIVGAATTAINQNFPETLAYNYEMQDAGAESYLDVWAAHFYGTQYYTLILPGGIADQLGSVSKPIWVTESGQKGVTKQHAYVEEMWPTLLDLVPGISRIYLYQFTENSPADSSFGLKNLTPGRKRSDLYQYLRNKKRR